MMSMQRIRNHLNSLRHLSWPSYGKKCSADKKGTHSIFHSVNIILIHIRLLLNLTLNNNSNKFSYVLNIIKKFIRRNHKFKLRLSIKFWQYSYIFLKLQLIDTK